MRVCVCEREILTHTVSVELPSDVGGVVVKLLSSLNISITGSTQHR